MSVFAGISWAEYKQVLGQGQTFGDIGMISNVAQKRTATVIAQSGIGNCLWLEINKVIKTGRTNSNNSNDCSRTKQWHGQPG